MEGKRYRNRQIIIRVTEAEKEAIKNRMSEAGYNDMSRFIRIMALQGYLVSLDLTDFQEYAAQISRVGNNINQIARKVNMEQEIFSVDIEELQDAMKEIEKTVQKCMDVFLNMEVDEFGDNKDSED